MSADREFPSDIAFTDTVKAIQEKSGSRSAYARMEQGQGWQTTVTPDLVSSSMIQSLRSSNIM